MKKESEELSTRVAFRKGYYTIYYPYPGPKILVALSLDCFLTNRLSFDGARIVQYPIKRW